MVLIAERVQLNIHDAKEPFFFSFFEILTSNVVLKYDE